MDLSRRWLQIPGVPHDQVDTYTVIDRSSKEY